MGAPAPASPQVYRPRRGGITQDIFEEEDLSNVLSNLSVARESTGGVDAPPPSREGSPSTLEPSRSTCQSSRTDSGGLTAVDRALERQAVAVAMHLSKLEASGAESQPTPPPRRSARTYATHRRYMGIPPGILPQANHRTYREFTEAERRDPPPPYTQHTWQRPGPGSSANRGGNHATARPQLNSGLRVQGTSAESHGDSPFTARRGGLAEDPSLWIRRRSRREVIGSRVRKSVSRVKKKAVELPKTAQRLHGGWRITRAKSKLQWLQKNGFLNDQERMLISDLEL